MMYRNVLGWVVGLVLAGAVLAACGGGAVPTSTPAPPTDAPVATATPSAHERLEQGRAYFEQGKPSEAIAEFKAAIELAPDNAIARHNLGAAYAYQGRWQEAAAAYEKAIELDPKRGESYGDVTWAYIELDRLPEAAAAGQKAIELAPQYVNGYNNLGMVYTELGRYTEAAALFNRALELDPQAARAWVNLGTVALRRSQYDEAIPRFQKAIQLDPQIAMAYNNLGIVYRALGKSAEAIAAYEAYLRVAPDAKDKAAVEREIAQLKAQPAEETATEYRNTAGGYRLRYPNGWYYEADKTQVLFSESKQALGTAPQKAPLVMFASESLSKIAQKLKVKDITDPLVALTPMAQQIAAELGKVEKGKIGDYPAALVNVTGTFKGVAYAGSIAVVLVDGRAVYGVAVTAPDQWSAFRPTFIEMLNSLSFFEP